jgi:hypothetical protein
MDGCVLDKDETQKDVGEGLARSTRILNMKKDETQNDVVTIGIEYCKWNGLLEEKEQSNNVPYRIFCCCWRCTAAHSLFSIWLYLAPTWRFFR